MDLKRGDIILVDLEPVKGSEQRKTRPAIVIQNDVGNKHAPTTIVAALTSSYDELYPTDVELKASQENVDKDCKVLLNQIFTVDINARAIKKLGNVSSEKIKEINKSIEISLGLQ